MRMLQRKRSNGKQNSRRVWILLGWLFIWQAVSLLCANSIFFVGPWETTRALFSLLGEADFLRTVLFSCGRVLLGIGLGITVGILLAAGSYKCRLMEEIWEPFMTMLKAIPVASFAVLLLIWWGSSYLSVCISFLVVLPQIYFSTLSGLHSTDKKLLEMGRSYGISTWGKIMYLYRPALKPFLESSFKIAVGMAWKSGVAAEVIGTPDFSIGNGLYMAKVHLDTAGVFAWTVLTILLSVLAEKVLLYGLKALMKWEPACRKAVSSRKKNGKTAQQVSLHAYGLVKNYDGKPVVNGYSGDFIPGQVTYFTTPSGSGKTTLLRLLCGLEQPDSGTVECSGCRAMMFQENRLCEAYSAVKNVELVCADAKLAREQLLRLLPADALDKPCSQLSGGMRRRVALVRALATNADCLLLDEPFTGLDEANKKNAMSYLLEQKEQKIILIAGHDIEIQNIIQSFAN